jgi:hypothetical protein
MVPLVSVLDRPKLGTRECRQEDPLCRRVWGCLSLKKGMLGVEGVRPPLFPSGRMESCLVLLGEGLGVKDPGTRPVHPVHRPPGGAELPIPGGIQAERGKG